VSNIYIKTDITVVAAGSTFKKASSIKSAGNFLVFIIEYKVKTTGYQYKTADFS